MASQTLRGYRPRVRESPAPPPPEPELPLGADLLQTALERFRVGDIEQARTLLVQLQQQRPDDAMAAYLLGSCELKLDRPAAAEPLLTQATKRPGTPVLAWLYLAMARQQLGTDDWYEPLTMAERHVPIGSMVEVARCWLAGGQRARAEHLLTKGVPTDVRSHLLRARLARRDADGGAVVHHAQNALRSARDHRNRNRAMSELGRGLDMVGRHADAWAVFEARNKQRWAAHNLPPDGYLQYLKAHLVFWTRTDALPASAPDDGGPTPHFLVGFPRSGTTLTEQCLSGHPSVRSLDERPYLAELFAELEQTRGWSLPHDLHRLQPADWQHLRDRYRESTGLHDGEFLIDKLPLNWVNLPLIRCLFPRSEVVVVLRDPRDACISGLMQEFDLNPSMIQFLVPERAGAMYNLVRLLGERYDQIEGLHTHRIVYRDLVTNQEDTLRTLLSQLGLQWDHGVLRPDRAASGRFISTPSRDQVCQPVHTRSLGRWKHYPQVVRRLDVDRWIVPPHLAPGR